MDEIDQRLSRIEAVLQEILAVIEILRPLIEEARKHPKIARLQARRIINDSTQRPGLW